MKTVVRWQKEPILKALKTRRVLILSGPRQSGKTTLCRSLDSHDIEYRTLDDSDFLEAARIDPGGFIKHQKSLLVIDAIQRVPQLLLAIKKQVDENNRPGQFLLTGSANIQATPTVIESLAGRVRHLRLRTLTQGEINGKIPTFLNNAFTENFSDNLQDLDKDAIISLAFTGGYPEAIALPPEDRAAWHIDYLDALI